MKAIILGAGVSGLAAVISLRKLGYHTTLVEQGEIGANLGGGIDLQPNGTRALYALGTEIEEAIKKLTVFNEREITISSNAGKTLNRIPLEQYEGDSRYPLLSFFRKDLLCTLFELALPNEVYEHSRCTEIYEGETGVEVVLENGTKIQGDFLIAADGINSVVRRTLFPQVEKRYLGHISLGGVIHRSHTKHNYIHGLNRTCVVFPCTETHCHTVMFLPKPQGWIYLHTPTFNERRALFRGWSDEVDHILEHLEETNRFCLESYEVPPLPAFASGRLFLLGDAAHAMSPLGALATALALEDNQTLGKLLSQDRSIQETAEDYSRLRRQRAEEMRDYSLSLLVPSIVSHGLEDFLARIDRFASSSPDQIFAPLKRLLQADCHDRVAHASNS